MWPGSVGFTEMAVKRFSGCLRNSATTGWKSLRYFSLLEGSMKEFIVIIVPAGHEEVI